MRLSDVLSKPPQNDYTQVDGFVQNKQGKVGQKVDLSVGQVMLNYYCEHCEDLRTFQSQGNLSCIFIDKYLISIDCVLICGCGANVPMWFLLESENDITSQAPKIRILRKSERLSDTVKINSLRYGDFSTLLNKAEQAYRNGLGAGAIVYLRKIFEKVTIQTANAIGLEYSQYEGGNPKNFSKLLKKVDEQCSIIPREFSSDGYRPFKELSNVVHGEYDENLGLAKFEPLHRLVIGILDNVKNSCELQNAKKALGWPENEEDTI